jgi:hypothetical protein
MDFLHLQKLVRKPQLYATGSHVMWTDPHISQQLLLFHIDPDHDTASRSRANFLGGILSLPRQALGKGGHCWNLRHRRRWNG